MVSSLTGKAHFDKYEDKLIIISSLSSLIWEEFLEKMSTLD